MSNPHEEKLFIANNIFEQLRCISQTLGRYGIGHVIALESGGKVAVMSASADETHEIITSMIKVADDACERGEIRKSEEGTSRAVVGDN